MESLTEENTVGIVMLYINKDIDIITVLYYIFILLLHSYVNNNSYATCSGILAEKKGKNVAESCKSHNKKLIFFCNGKSVGLLPTIM